MNSDDLEDGGLPDFLRDPVGLLRRRWPWMSAALLLGLAATGTFAALKSPTFSARASVLVTSQQITKDFVRPTIAEDSFQRINAMVGEMLSRDKLGELIEKHDLYPESREVPITEIAARMRNSIVIAPERNVGRASRYETALVFVITFVYGDPQLAADVANDLARLFTSENIRTRSEQAHLTTAFLTEKLEESERELREQNRRITEFKQRYRGELPDDLEANLGRLDRMQRNRQSLALQIAEANTRVAMLSSQMLSSGDFASPEARLAQLRGELGEQLGIRTEQHPDVASLRRQIASLENEIAAASQPGSEHPTSHTTLVAAARKTLEELETQLASAKVEVRLLDARVAKIPARQEILTALEERETVLRENYLNFMRKVQDSELSESLEVAQQGARFSVMDWATPPAHPNGSRGKLLVIGLIASLGLSVLAGVALEIFDPVLVRSDQVEADSGLPVLGSAPEIS